MSFLRRFLLIFTTSLCATSCSRSNNLLLGRVESKLGSHKVVVTDCYRIHVPEPVFSDSRYKYEPCRDGVVVIDRERLTVNGKTYGNLRGGDSVLVDHGVVSIY